jgi:iron(III) transport system permease protein
MLSGTAGTSLSAAITAVAGERQLILITQTLILGLGTAATALCVGLPIGIALARCDPRRVVLVRFAFVVPLVLPSYVLALAWVVIADPSLARWTYSLPGAVVVLGFSFYPVVMLATEAAVRNVPRRLEEAGRLVASARRVWWSITLPLIAPSVVASLLVVLVLAISDFAVPSMLRVRVYTTEVFTTFSALYNFHLATVMALPLAFTGAIAAIAALQVVRRPLIARHDQGQSGLRWRDGYQQVAATILAVAGLAAVITPVGAIAIAASTGRATFTEAASMLAIWNGVVWSGIAASLVVLVGALLGYWRAKNGSVKGRALEVLWIMLFAVPPTVAGIGLIGLWNRPGILGDIYRTDTIVVIAYVSRFLPLGALMCAAFLRRVPAGVEEAAVVSGASWSRTFSSVVLPLSMRGLAAVWLVMFILMFGDVALAILVAPPGEANLAVRAYTLIANSPVGDVARIALVQVAMSIVPLSALVALTKQANSS